MSAKADVPRNSTAAPASALTASWRFFTVEEVIGYSQFPWRRWFNRLPGRAALALRFPRLSAALSRNPPVVKPFRAIAEAERRRLQRCQLFGKRPPTALYPRRNDPEQTYGAQFVSSAYDALAKRRQTAWRETPSACPICAQLTSRSRRISTITA